MMCYLPPYTYASCMLIDGRHYVGIFRNILVWFSVWYRTTAVPEPVPSNRLTPNLQAVSGSYHCINTVLIHVSPLKLIRRYPWTSTRVYKGVKI